MNADSIFEEKNLFDTHTFTFIFFGYSQKKTYLILHFSYGLK